MKQHACQSVPKQVILSIPSAIHCKGLSSLLADEGFVVCEARTEDELERKLSLEQAYFVIVEQSLVHDISLLPEGQFIIMARIPDRMLFLDAVAHKACGYFLYTVSINLIREAILASPDQCYLDPALALWVAELLTEREKISYYDVALTPREREVFALKEQHFSTREIAAQLNISEATVKKHVHNALCKLPPDRK